MTITGLPGEGEWPTRTFIEMPRLEAAQSEEPFLEAAMELATEYGRFAALLAAVRAVGPHDTEASRLALAIQRGLIVRIVKFSQRLLAETYEGRGETQALFDRLLFETTAALAFLLRGNSARAQAFVRDSLRADRLVWEHLDHNQDQRQDIALPQEVRMRHALRRSFSLASVPPEEINLEDPPDEAAWPPLEGQLEAIGEPDAWAMHQLGSFMVHGLWNELITHHLTEDLAGDGGTAGLDTKVNWSRARVEPLFALVIQGSRVLAAYAMRLGPEATDGFRGKLLDLARRAADADRQHELYLARADVPRGSS